MKILILSLFISISYANEKSICGKTDDRTLSFENEIGRSSKLQKEIGCTATLIGPSCVISAGHCLGSIEKVSFNIPSSEQSSPTPANEVDIYFQDKSFLEYEDGVPGKDWVVFRLQKNKITNRYPGEVQGYLKVDYTKNAVKVGDIVRVSGYGFSLDNPIKSFAQQSDQGSVQTIGGSLFTAAKIGYRVDTSRGTSGSSIINTNSNMIVGVHSRSACRVSSGRGVKKGYNEGTLISKNKKFRNAIKKCLKLE